VIAWHGAGNARLGRLAAESWVGLALILETRPDSGDAGSRDRQAADAYRRSIGLTEVPERKGELWGMLGDVHGRLGEVEQARTAYAEAMRLDPGNRDRYQRRLERLPG
jgi:hypothetical protein